MTFHWGDSRPSRIQSRLNDVIEVILPVRFQLKIRMLSARSPNTLPLTPLREGKWPATPHEITQFDYQFRNNAQVVTPICTLHFMAHEGLATQLRHFKWARFLALFGA